KKHKLKKETANSIDKEIYILDVILYVKKYIDPNDVLLPGNITEGDGQLGVISVLYNSVEAISSINAKIPNDIKDKKNMQYVERVYFEVLKRFKGDIPTMDPIEEMKKKDEKSEEIIQRKGKLEKTLEKTMKESLSS